MFLSDFYSAIQWWFVILLLGIGFLPITILLFKNFFDKGYIFSKLLGIVFTSYALFILGILHLVPFQMISSYCVFLALVFLSLFLLSKKWDTIAVLAKQSWRIFIFEEILFLLALCFWARIHGFAPEIHGLEKYMDFGFVNSMLRHEYFPPKDMWFPPLFINYYYFGHLMTAVLTKLSGIPSQITFNLMLSTIFAFCFVETFSIGANLYTFMQKNTTIRTFNRTVAGFLTAFLTTFAGNLHVLYGFFKPYANDKPQPPWELTFLPSTFPNGYWYPNATRYIYHTIHEFPIYSWVVADLHGHVLDIPFVLLMIGLIMSIFMSYETDKKPEKNADAEKIKTIVFLSLAIISVLLAIVNMPSILKIVFYVLMALSSYFLSKKPLSFFIINPFVLLLTGFLLAVMYMTNAWDGAIYFLLSTVVIGYIHWQQLPQQKKVFLQWINKVFFSFLPIISSFILFTAPYNFFFKPFVSGIGILCSPDFLSKIDFSFLKLGSGIGKLGPLLFETNHCEHSYWWELLILYGFFLFFILVFLFFLSRAKKLLHTDIFVLLLIALGMILIFIPEFIYVKDIYPAHYRANTMFKLVFQAFIILSISSGYVIARIASVSKIKALNLPNKILYLFFFIVTTCLLTAVLTYPFLAIKAYYGDLKEYKGLDGLTYMKNSYPTDYEAIKWLNKNVPGQPVILEAQGDSYTDYARVSANTGLPTVLGWTVHEWLWRGSYDIPAPRITDVQKLYETPDPAIAKQVIEQHSVQYIFLGDLERQKYPKLSEDKFVELGKVVYQNGNTKIYKLNTY